jgi:hypothetical protein
MFKHNVLFFLIGVTSALAHAQTATTEVPPTPMGLENSVVHYYEQDGRASRSDCFIAFDDTNETHDTLFKSSHYHQPYWFPIQAGVAHEAKAIRTWITYFETTNPTIRQDFSKSAQNYLEVVDRSQNPSKVIPVYGKGRRIVEGIDDAKATQFLEYVKRFCFP